MEISSFIVMDILERAKELERQGIDVVHMEVGEPDFPTPREVIEAGREALAQKATFYTQSVGIPELKEAISQHYRASYGIAVSPDRIVVTPGSSPALMAAIRIALEKGGVCGLPDPGYPCYKNMVNFLGGQWRPLNVGAEQGFKVSPEQLEGVGSVVLNSPSNPTGAVYSRHELEKLVNIAQKEGITIISDEIYHGITYTAEPVPSVLEFTDEAMVVNGFSKFFLMTGWRLGWIVVPQSMVRLMQCIAQNLFICPPAVAQKAALACFTSSVMEQLRQKVEIYRKRRDYIIEALKEMDIPVTPVPQGAFYIYADVSRYTQDSFTFCKQALEEAHIGITPGVDFGSNNTNLYIRFSYANTLERLKEGMNRLRRWLSDNR
jgi:aspartate/methionine/tyrosine aminotransferase